MSANDEPLKPVVPPATTPGPCQCGIEPEQHCIGRNVLSGRSRFITRQQTSLDEGMPRLALFGIQLHGFQRKTGQTFVFLHVGSAQPPHQQQAAAEGFGGADAVAHSVTGAMDNKPSPMTLPCPIPVVIARLNWSGSVTISLPSYRTE